MDNTPATHFRDLYIGFLFFRRCLSSNHTMELDRLDDCTGLKGWPPLQAVIVSSYLSRLPMLRSIVIDRLDDHASLRGNHIIAIGRTALLTVSMDL